MLIQLYTLQTSWCEYWWVFARNGLVLRGLTQAGYKSGVRHGRATWTLWTVDCGGRRARPPGPPVATGGAGQSPPGAGGGTGRDAEGRPRGDGSSGRLTHRQHAHELTARPSSRLSSGGWAGHRAALSSILVQWAAKVAFFKLKLDQLMDSLCRVCLAESKQNLEDTKRHSHGVGGAWPSLAAAETPNNPRPGSPPDRGHGCWGGRSPRGTSASALDTPADLCLFLSVRRERARPGPATAGTLPSLTHESRGCD